MDGPRSRHSSLAPLVLLLCLVPRASGLATPAPDFSLLSRRIASQQADEATVQCLLLDAMLPRQRLTFQFGPPVSTTLSEVRKEKGMLAVVGINPRTGDVLKRGVEARIESMSPYRASDGYFSSHSTTPQRGFTALDTTLVGGRRCEILDTGDCPWPPDRQIFTARVKWLEDERGTAAATLLAQRIAPLVSEWTALVRETGRERQPDQISNVLRDLGPMPDAEDADDLALWTAALVNPLPALGVAVEIRPYVLEASTPMERVEASLAALNDSISKLRGRPPGTFEVEPPPKQ